MNKTTRPFNPFAKKPLQSKKWIISIVGLSCVMLTYFVSLIVAIKNSAIAPHIVSLSNLVITFLGGLVGAYTIGQSFVDWKSSTSIENISRMEHERSDLNADIKIMDHYADKYKDDESYAPLNYYEIN